jgi:pre-mRNA-splicing factor 38A
MAEMVEQTSSSSSSRRPITIKQTSVNLIEKITRMKIFNSNYYKENCFALTAETILDKIIELKYCGGIYGGAGKPSPFICLVLKLLQLQPDEDIIFEYIYNEDFKYLRALGAFYLRLTANAVTVYNILEPLYCDYRKLAYRSTSGWEIKRMDEFIDELLCEELVCDIALPHILGRHQLELQGLMIPYKSCLSNVESLLTERENGHEKDDGEIVHLKGSVAYWNQERKKLGMKPLRP